MWTILSSQHLDLWKNVYMRRVVACLRCWSELEFLKILLESRLAMGLQGMEILAYFYEPFTEIKCNNVNTILNLSFKHYRLPMKNYLHVFSHWPLKELVLNIFAINFSKNINFNSKFQYFLDFRAVWKLKKHLQSSCIYVYEYMYMHLMQNNKYICTYKHWGWSLVSSVLFF